MSDEERIRSLVRETVERQLRGAPARPAPAPLSVRSHPSHVRFAVSAGGDGDGACLIEPAVACVHCGYCQSYGH